MRPARCVVLLIAVLSLAAASTVAQESEQYKGRSLADALRMLQERGLRIVFTSAMVTPDLRVRVEPRGSTARHQLDELLAPHGLRAREGPGGTIQVVRAETAVTTPHLTATGTIGGRVVHVLTAAPIKGVIVRVDGAAAVSRTDATGRFLLQNVDAGTRTIRASIPGYALGTRAVYIAPGTTITVTVSLSPAASTHSEHVTVSQPRPYREDRGVASETSLDRGQLERLYGSPGDDPIRAFTRFPASRPSTSFGASLPYEEARFDTSTSWSTASPRTGCSTRRMGGAQPDRSRCSRAPCSRTPLCGPARTRTGTVIGSGPSSP